jgi:hypothetical protein
MMRVFVGVSRQVGTSYEAIVMCVGEHGAIKFASRHAGWFPNEAEAETAAGLIADLANARLRTELRRIGLDEVTEDTNDGTD